jgi:hypothetical protein
MSNDNQTDSQTRLSFVCGRLVAIQIPSWQCKGY